MPGPDVTPSGDLLLEVLAARYRTGERMWTFETRHLKTARTLEDKGLVSTMHGVIEKTFRASLTEAGKQFCLGSDYVSPIERELKEAKRKKKGKGSKW